MLHNADVATAAPLDLLDATEEVRRFAELTALWHTEDFAAQAAAGLPEQLHRANFDLWHLEDRARDPHATDAVIAEVKRAIDRTNQQRNDLVERTDAWLLGELIAAGLPNGDAPLHSETPGLMLDRLSILSLKFFHTAEELARADADASHRERNQARLLVLEEQRSDLAGCLADLWREVCLGSRRFKLYRQLKMYNDPELNPVLYRATAADG